MIGVGWSYIFFGLASMDLIFRLLSLLLTRSLLSSFSSRRRESSGHDDQGCEQTGLTNAVMSGFPRSPGSLKPRRYGHQLAS